MQKLLIYKQVAYIEKTFKNNKEEHIKQYELQVKYIDENNITFGGVKPYKIYENNEGNNESIYITFKANTVRKDLNPIYITTDKNNSNCHFMEDVKYFPSQSPKMYIQEETKAFEVLENIINDKTLWESKNTTPKVQEIIDKIKDDKNNEYNFINIIKKENDELVFSNLFKYIFDSNPNAFSKFVKEVLEIKDFSNNFMVLREKANIDLLILDKNNAIVIENKIKSSINGICERHDIGSELIQSQLKKYKDFVEKNYDDKDKHYFIFAPNYNHISLRNYKCGKNYKLIEFSKIFDFFDKNKDLYKNVKYFNEFLFALQKHTRTKDSSHEEIMYKRFVEAIYKAKKK